MSFHRRRFIGFAAAAVALPSLSRAHAQSYPSRPVSMIVPYAAGGPTDTIGRIVAEHMRSELGQTIVPENIGGAAGSTGIGRLARAPADGLTIEVGNWSAMVVNGAIYPLPYDLKQDFEPIVLLAEAPQLVVAKKAVPPNDLKEFIAWLKANPDKTTTGTSGAGSPPHVAAILFQTMTGTRSQFVPCKGNAPAMQDLVAGQIDVIFSDPTTAIPQINGGTIKAFAVAQKTRLPAAPNLPTSDEAGLSGFYAGTWNALFAPKGTPKDIIARLNAAAVKALAEPAVRARLTGLGQQIPPREQQTPEALGALHRADIEKWWPIVKAANIKPS
jgi:tripartite-type tricarboxylate transporter receptor subunit TctC